MHTFPLWLQFLILTVLILCSAFFSMTETALMAANRYRLRHLAKRGNKNAVITMWLLDRIEKLLSVILIANTLFNALTTALVTSIAITMFGNHDTVITLTTFFVAFLLIVFAEISPKVIGATYPERISLATSLPLKLLIKVGLPVTWFVNLFVGSFLKLLRVKIIDSSQETRLSPEELRSMILESGNFIPQKHKSILVNLFDLENISVEDVMISRAQIEALDFSVSVEEIKHQLTTCYHNKLPVYEGEINRIIGILHVRKAIALLNQEHELTTQHFRQLLSPAYFIPEDTGVFTQLQYFQEKRERFGIVIDEYGEVQGLVTLDDIIEEMIGEFTSSIPGDSRIDALIWDEHNQCVVDGAMNLRDINKKLHLDFPTDGPKTLNGLLLEILQDIPDAPVSININRAVVEIIQVQNQAIKMAKIIRLLSKP